MNEQEVIQTLKRIITLGTDNYEKWVIDNPKTVSEILKAHYQLFLTEIIEGEILNGLFE